MHTLIQLVREYFPNWGIKINMTTKEMQDTLFQFRERYPNHRGLDLKTQREVLSGIKKIVRMPNSKFCVMTKEDVSPGGRLDKINSVRRKANALNRKILNE